jgi:tRNA nucleotidyltransferase (CCA-adding enzyme)
MEVDRADLLLDLARAEAAALPPRRRAGVSAQVEACSDRVAAVRRTSPALTVGALALDGRAVAAALGGPGPLVGEALRHLLDRVLGDPALNEPEALRAELARWREARDAGGRTPTPR